MKVTVLSTILLSLVACTLGANFTLVKEYSGSSFFDDWDFYGDSNVGVNNTLWNGTTPWDDLTNGDVFYMGRNNGSSLYHVDPTTGHAFIKVDNTSLVPDLQKRDSIRITSQDFFNYGTVWVFDVYHLPWGCSVWPSIWTTGLDWPNHGEIDIVEGVNRMTFNQMALHSTEGCTAANGTDQTGTPGSTDCAPLSGCTVAETKPNNYGPDFAANGGGVWAAQFDVSGIFIWFWGRADVPTSITTVNDSIDISSWGPPSAAFPASTCDIPNFFGPQQLVIDITLCGDWAGEDSVYAQTCNDTPQQPSQRCYNDNVINNGTADYSMAYFELGAIRAFSSNTTALPSASPTSITPGSTASASEASSGSSTSLSSGAGSPAPTGSGKSSSATALSNPVGTFVVVLFMCTSILLF